MSFGDEKELFKELPFYNTVHAEVKLKLMNTFSCVAIFILHRD